MARVSGGGLVFVVVEGEGVGVLRGGCSAAPQAPRSAHVRESVMGRAARIGARGREITLG
ncbi:MAG TPA: hypothetical protein PK156_09250 [Polyangium sp.]|nr:hypothetical protein [Polyangium sp.]